MTSNYMNGGKREEVTVFKLSGLGWASFILPWPIIAFVSCILLSMINDFEASTATHCRVKNYLPTISSAIGGFTPQRYIWRICIALQSAPRIMVAVMIYNYFMTFRVRSKQNVYSFLAMINCILHILENLSLVALSYISSTENHGLHENSFIGFVVFSQTYMLLTCILYKWAHNEKPMSEKERRSFRYKVILFLVNFSSFLIAVYFFFRHNSYCEPGVYTLFALAEYILVVTNIAFHGMILLVEFCDNSMITTQPASDAQLTSHIASVNNGKIE